MWTVGSSRIAEMNFEIGLTRLSGYQSSLVV